MIAGKIIECRDETGGYLAKDKLVYKNSNEMLDKPLVLLKKVIFFLCFPTFQSTFHM